MTSFVRVVRALSLLPPLRRAPELSHSPAAISGADERAARVSEKLGFGALLTLIVLAGLPPAEIGSWRESAVSSGIFALSCFWLVQRWRALGHDGRCWTAYLHLFLPLLMMSALALVQTWPLSGGGAESLTGADWPRLRTLSADPYETRLFAFKLFSYVLFGALLLDYTADPAYLRTLIYLLITIGLVSALYGLVRHFDEQNMISHHAGLSAEGTFGQFANRNHFALLMEMSLGLVLGFVGGARPARALLLLLLAAPLWVALISTSSRGGVMSALALVAFLGLLELWRRISRDGKNRARAKGRTLLLVTLLAGLLLAAAGSVIWINGETLMMRLERVPQELSVNERRGGSRMDIWMATWRMFKENPVAGTGFGGFAAAIPAYYNASGEWTPEQAHNEYLELLAGGGLIGAGLGLWFGGGFLYHAGLQLRQAHRFRRAAATGALGSLFAVAIHSLVDFGLHVTVNALFFVALVVVTINRREIDAR